MGIYLFSFKIWFFIFTPLLRAICESNCNIISDVYNGCRRSSLPLWTKPGPSARIILNQSILELQDACSIVRFQFLQVVKLSMCYVVISHIYYNTDPFCPGMIDSLYLFKCLTFTTNFYFFMLSLHFPS